MKQFILIFGLIFLFSGCAHKSASNVLIEHNGDRVINNQELNQKVIIDNFRSKFNSNLLLAAVDVKNTSQASLDLEYKFRWYDSAGFEVSSTPWMPVTLNAMEKRSLQQISTTPKAQTFKFYIRNKQ